MERLEIIESLKHFPAQLDAALAGVPDTVLRSQPADGEWSIKEVIGHVAYAEEIWYRRLYQVWSLHDPVLMAFDEDAEHAQTAQAQDASNLRSYLDEIEAKRPRVVNLLVQAVDWTRTGQWTGEGRRSLKQLAEALLKHDQDHLRQIEAAKAVSGVEAIR